LVIDVVDAYDISQANFDGVYWKFSSVDDLRRDPMTTIDKNNARFAAALSLHDIAAHLRKFAEEAGNPAVLDAHLRLLAKYDKEAAALFEGSIQLAAVNRGASGCGGPPPSFKKCASTRTVIFRRQGRSCHVGS
jgi:hypothetical protein